MQCPKCGFTHPEQTKECLRCGIVFAKYKLPAATPRSRPDPDETFPEDEKLWCHPDFWFSLPHGTGRLGVLARGMVLLLLLGFTLSWAFAGGASSAMESMWHLVNLPFHEAGHILFRPFGAFVTSLGGTLLQLLVPLVCGGVLFLQQKDGFAAAFCLWWFGENFLDIAPYMADARTGVLPLVGGNTGQSSPYGFHDWEFLLTETGWIAHDQVLAGYTAATGWIVMIAGLVWGAMVFGWQAKRHFDF